MISMKKVNYAAIDIGSNAVRLLIKCVNEENAPELMSKVQLIRIPLRLGEDAFTVGVISTEKEKKLIRLMKAYKQLMKIYDVVDYRACATSAMRDARNGKDIVQQIVKKNGYPCRNHRRAGRGAYCLRQSYRTVICFRTKLLVCRCRRW